MKTQVGKQPVQNQNHEDNHEVLHGGLSEHAITEDHRKEADMSEPMVKIRKVAVVGPNKKDSDAKLAKQINLK